MHPGSAHGSVLITNQRLFPSTGSSSLLTGLLSVMDIVSLNHMHAQSWRFAAISVNIDTKNQVCCLSVDSARPCGWQNYAESKSHKNNIQMIHWSDQTMSYNIPTHSISSINRVLGQSFSGNLCRISPLLVPLPGQSKYNQSFLAQKQLSQFIISVIFIFLQYNTWCCNLNW